LEPPRRAQPGLDTTFRQTWDNAISSFLPAFILSGFVFDINSMPRAVQIITHIVAARYFVAILQSVFLAGNVWSVILPNAAALAVMAAVFLGAARIVSRKRLD
jgi:ABC-2 type transport system permease protein